MKTCKEKVRYGKWGLNVRSCMGTALEGSEFCAAHDPGRIAERREAERTEMDSRLSKIRRGDNLAKLFTSPEFQPVVDAFYSDSRGKRLPLTGDRFEVRFRLSADQIEWLAAVLNK